MLRGLWRRSRARTGSDRASLRAAVLRPAVLEAMEQRLMLSADPIITEFMADNKHTLKDGFGSYSDWIEIYNPDSAPASLAGWYLTDTAKDLRQWQFPAISVPAGGYLVVFASGRDVRIAGQELHTNFQLAADGEYLALVKPDGVTITSQYGPKYPKQVPDLSFGLAAQSSTAKLVSAGAAASVLVPGNDMGLEWTGASFDDRAWPIHGPTAVGFDASGVGQFSVTEAWSSAALNNIDDAINFLSSGRGTIYNYSASVINLRDSDSQDGNFWDGTLFKGDKPGQDPNFALRITGTIHVPTSGEWTFGVNSDDGFRLKIQGARFTSTSDWETTVSGDTMTHANGRPQMDSLGVAEIDAGDHAVELYFYQGYGEAEVEFFAAEGAKSSYWDGGFALVGDVYGGGLAVVGTKDQIKTDIQGAMLNKNASAYVRVPFTASDVDNLGRMVLRMRYDDGFVAYINGHEVARSENVPSTVKWNSAATSEGSDADAAVFEDFDISNAIGFLNRGGQNVLAIQALNAAADNPDLLVWPELVASTRPAILDQPRYLLTPTAGEINTSGMDALGPVITDVTRDVALPKDSDNVAVTAKVTKAIATVAGVNLHYRVNYGSEVVVPMLDDGKHGDGKAGDGVYGASIPGSASRPGQMVRYYVTASDSGSRPSRWPLIPAADPDPISTRKWPEYEGFMIADPSVNSSLPTLYWFIEDPGSATSRQGTRASMYYNGQFYDNVFCRARGGYSTGGT
ncbi:MAG: lamin tail domain-containing protein [Bacillota bacterium]